MRLRLIRHATLLVGLAGRQLLVDPALDPRGARAPDPLSELPEPGAVLVSRLDGVLVTRVHPNHLDETAVDLLAKDLPVLCRAQDEGVLRDRGFVDVRPVTDSLVWEGVTVTRAGGSGFVLAAPAEPVLYLAGDTVWGDEVRGALDEHRPDVAVVNAGGARRAEGERITMTAGDVVAVARHSPDVTVVAVHLEAVEHLLETRVDLRRRLHDEDLEGRVVVPEDGAAVPLS